MCGGYACRGQRTACGSQLFPSSVWVLRIELEPWDILFTEPFHQPSSSACEVILAAAVLTRKQWLDFKAGSPTKTWDMKFSSLNGYVCCQVNLVPKITTEELEFVFLNFLRTFMNQMMTEKENLENKIPWPWCAKVFYFTFFFKLKMCVCVCSAYLWKLGTIYGCISYPFTM